MISRSSNTSSWVSAFLSFSYITIEEGREEVLEVAVSAYVKGLGERGAGLNDKGQQKKRTFSESSEEEKR
jgi:hypothetical protein